MCLGVQEETDLPLAYESHVDEIPISTVNWAPYARA